MWPLVIVAAVGMVLALGLRLGPRVFGGLRGVTRSFRCPFRQTNVAVEFQETVWDARRVGVSRCTAFTPPTAIDCERRCLELTAFEAPSRDEATR